MEVWRINENIKNTYLYTTESIVESTYKSELKSHFSLKLLELKKE